MANRLFCRRKGPGGDYCVTIRDDKLVLTLPNNNDPAQLWYKSKCVEGFLLVHRATGKVVRHSGVGDQLYLDVESNYEPSVRWTETGDLGCGFTSFRPLNNQSLGMDAWNGHIFDGTLVSVYPSSIQHEIGENAQWKLVPVPTPAAVPTTPTPTPTPTHVPVPAPEYKGPSNMIYCLAGDAQHSVAIQAGKIVLAYPNPKDPAQHWYKDDSQKPNCGSFMLVNKATGQAAKQCSDDQPLLLVSRPITPDGSFLWTESESDGYGFTFIVTANNSGFAMDARNGDRKGAQDVKFLSYSRNLKGDNQKWKFTAC